MLANFNNLNTRSDLKDLVVWSCDAKALYGSLQAKRSAAIVAKHLRRTDLQFTGIHWDQAALYLAVTVTRQQVEELGLGELVPRWRKASTATCAPPGITTAEVKGPLQGAHKAGAEDHSSTGGRAR